VDVSDPTEPREVGFYDTPGFASGVAVSPDGLVFVADITNLGIYDTSEAMGVSSDFILHPSSFILSAYPNPFNSTTTITYYLPKASPISVRIYDLSGRRVATLVNGYVKAGQHTALWDAGAAAAGVYVVRMEAGQFGQSRWVTLVK
jgi:hypothetical protein